MTDVNRDKNLILKELENAYPSSLSAHDISKKLQLKKRTVNAYLYEMLITKEAKLQSDTENGANPKWTFIPKIPLLPYTQQGLLLPLRFNNNNSTNKKE